MRLEDGEGSGHEAGVTSAHKLKVEATMHSLEHERSHEHGDAYFANIADTADSLTITGTGGPILLIRNDSEQKDLVIRKVLVGTSSANMILKVVRNPLIGSLGNVNVHVPGNLNFASGNAASVSIWNWDEVGNGITGLTDGTVLNTYIFQSWSRVLPFDDAFILGKNNAIAFECKGVGELTLGVRFFMQPPPTA